MDAQMKASRAQTGTGRMSGRVNNDDIRRTCPKCNGKRVVPSVFRTTRRNASAEQRDNHDSMNTGCGWCGGDGYLDPGDKGFKKL